MDTQMQSPNGSSVSGTPSGSWKKKIMFGILLVVILGAAGLYLYNRSTMNDGTFTEKDRQALIDRIAAESAEANLPDAERNAAIDRISKEKQTSSMTEAQRQKIIDTMAAESAQ